MKFGDALEWFQELEASGKEVKALEDRPEIFPDLAQDYEAFWLISSGRTVGFGGPDPLRLTEVLAYMDMFGIRGNSVRRTLLKRIRILDRTYLKWHSQKKPTHGQPVQDNRKRRRNKV